MLVSRISIDFCGPVKFLHKSKLIDKYDDHYSFWKGGEKLKEGD